MHCSQFCCKYAYNNCKPKGPAAMKIAKAAVVRAARVAAGGFVSPPRAPKTVKALRVLLVEIA